MGLQIWLPLIGDMHNQGMSGVTVTSTSATVDANGKIGSCMKIVDAVDLYYAPDFGTGSFSFCGWFKFNKAEITTKVSTLTINATYKQPTGNLIGNNSYGGIGITWNANNVYADGAFNSMSIMGTIRTSTISARNTGSFAVSFDTWIHIALLWDYEAKKLSIYKDGIHYASTTTPDFSDAVIRSLCINYPGVWSGNGPNTTIPFRANDIRVYNHCLSAKEVKEISKGLVTHYSFGQSPLFSKMLTENLQGITLNDGSTWVKLMHHNNPAANLFTTSNCKNNEAENLYSKLYLIETDANFKSTDGYYEYLVKEKATSASTETTIRMKQTSNPATTSTITGVVIVDAGTAPTARLIGLKHNGSSAYMHNGSSWWCAVGAWNRYNGGIPGFLDTVTSGYLDFYMRIDSGTYGNSKIYDVSGNKNDGTLNGTTTTIDSVSPRYSHSIHLKNSGDNITIPMPQLHTFTYSFWFKRDRVSQSNREMLMTGWYGVSFELNPNNTLTFKCACTSSHVERNVVTSFVFSSTEVWYHVAFTHTDGVGSKIYVNGNLEKTASFTDLIDYTSSTARIGYYSSSLYFLGQYSDFRIYGIELSADDIKELYNVSNSIDNKGNLLTYELKEV